MLSSFGPAIRLLGLGWLVVIAIVGGLLLGLWVDGVFRLGFPIFALLGLALGVFTAFIGVRRLVAQATEADASQEREDG